jgi:hypothetical protein
MNSESRTFVVLVDGSNTAHNAFLAAVALRRPADRVHLVSCADDSKTGLQPRCELESLVEVASARDAGRARTTSMFAGQSAHTIEQE